MIYCNLIAYYFTEDLALVSTNPWQGITGARSQIKTKARQKGNSSASGDQVKYVVLMHERTPPQILPIVYTVVSSQSTLHQSPLFGCQVLPLSSHSLSRPSIRILGLSTHHQCLLSVLTHTHFNRHPHKSFLMTKKTSPPPSSGRGKKEVSVSQREVRY